MLVSKSGTIYGTDTANFSSVRYTTLNFHPITYSRISSRNQFCPMLLLSVNMGLVVDNICLILVRRGLSVSLMGRIRQVRCCKT